MKKPDAQPRTCRTRLGQPERSQRPGQRCGQTVARNVAKAQAPKTDSTQEPSDIGDQYLRAGDCSARLQPRPLKGKPSANAALTTSDLNSMCQKRSGRLRSTMRKTVQS